MALQLLFVPTPEALRPAFHELAGTWPATANPPYQSQRLGTNLEMTGFQGGVLTPETHDSALASPGNLVGVSACPRTR